MGSFSNEKPDVIFQFPSDPLALCEEKPFRSLASELILGLNNPAIVFHSSSKP